MNRNLCAALLACLLLLPGGALSARDKALNFALSGNPDTLDPQKTSGTLTFQTLKSIYDTLVEPDQTGAIVPALAESWTVSADNLTWTFKLRPGVFFHNGDRLDSADVKATLDRMRDKATASPKVVEFTTIASIDTPDDATVVIRLSKPSAPFLATLASGWAAILPKSLIDSGNDFATRPVGTGPFMLKEFVRDSRIVLVKNPRYWMPGLPRLDQVIMNIIPERSVQVQGLLTGAIDAVEFVNTDDIQLLASSSDVKIDKSLTADIMVMSMNCSNPILSDLRVRQAVTYAIDKQKVLDIAYGGGKVIGTFMDAANAYYKDFTSLYPYNPDKARSLLKEAGVPADAVFTMVLPSNYDLHVKAGQLYQEMLSNVGLKVNIKMVDWPTWISDVYTNARYDFTVIGHTGKLDPDGTLSGYGGKSRYVRWDNPAALDLITRAAGVTGFDARKKLYDQALEIMAREVPFVYLGSAYRYRAYRSNVSEYRMTPKLDTYDFRWTDLK
ncbi:MAG TPA: ABC transporter substrate-binding protein [Spirochaetia bacterium]|nr:ABC transporter substrate-binding protein [Spirochaetia bacterium]